MTAFGLLALGCTPHFPVAYSVDDVPARVDPGLAAVHLRIAPFRDERASLAANQQLFSSDRDASVDGKSSCINAEKNYEEHAVPDQLADAIAQHLRKLGAYGRVTVGPGQPGTYTLTGSVRRFYGVQETSSAAEVGAAFGLVGALATSGAKTPGRVEIHFANLELYGPDGQAVARLQDVYYQQARELPADAYCNAIFQNVNEGLKYAVAQLAAQLADTMHRVVVGIDIKGAPVEPQAQLAVPVAKPAALYAPAAAPAPVPGPAPGHSAAEPPAAKPGAAAKAPKAAKAGGCTKDAECKGDRICVNGTCVDGK
jgi:hypothetical protein